MPRLASDPTLPLLARSERAVKRSRAPWTAFLVMVLISCVALSVWHHAVDPALTLAQVDEGVCPQVPPYDPSKALKGKKMEPFTIHKVVTRLSEAIQIDTSIGDLWADPDDAPELWEPVFHPFARWLKRSFPTIHDSKSPLTREFVHQHALVYTWPGKNKSLKPLMITAHQDVVPAMSSTLDQWRFPPFSGHIDYDNQTVWGRGAIDCKLWLVGAMSAVERLVESHFVPERTLVLAFGIDEESDGLQGARHLGKFLEERYGKNGIAMIVDEGQPVYSPNDVGSFGLAHAAPSVTERGSAQVRLKVAGAGGHSSMPPPHTAIGVLSAVIKHLEDHPFPQELREELRPSIQQLQCLRDAPGMPAPLRKALLRLDWAERSMRKNGLSHASFWHRVYESMLPHSSKRRRLDHARGKVLDALDYSIKVLMMTTQAFDVIKGGEKANALPENAEVFVNHRIATYSSVKEVIERYETVLKPLAPKYGLSIQVNNKTVVPPSKDTLFALHVDRIGLATDTRPPSPFEGEEAGPWRLLSSVIRQTWKLDEPRQVLHANDESAEPKTGNFKKLITVAPSSMFGNTDTRWYMVRMFF